MYRSDLDSMVYMYMSYSVWSTYVYNSVLYLSSGAST